MSTAVLLALSAAIFAALAIQMQGKALAYLDDLSGTFVTVTTVALLSWVGAGWRIREEDWASPAIPYFVAAGLLFPALGQRLQIASTRHVGPALTSAFGAFAPFFAAMPAIVLLGETLSMQQILGVFLLVGALLLAAISRGVSWRGRAFYFLLLPLGAAMARAMGMPIAKTGYLYLPDPFFALIVIASTSTLVVLAMLLMRGAPFPILQPGLGHILFAANGLLVGAAILAIQLSLIAGPVSVTASLIATAPIWALVLGALVFKTEKLLWWHSVVAVIVSLGAVLIVTGAAPD